MRTFPAGLSRRQGLVLGLGVALPLLIFAALAVFVAPGSPPRWDRDGFAHLYSGESDWPFGPTPGRDNAVLEVIMPQLLRLTDDREILVLVAVILVGALVARRVRAALFFLAAVAIGLLAPLVKNLFERPSPFPLPGDYSFPSGHAIVAMAIAAAAVALLATTRWLIPALIAGLLLVLAISLPVIADGGHWPSDVVAGWCVAIAWVSILYLVIGGRRPDLLGRAGGSPGASGLTENSHKV